MWNDLTMSERANVIKMAVKAGLRDMNSIRKFYDDSLKYADGGPKKSFDDWYKTVPVDRNDTTDYDLRRAYELAPIEELESWRTSSIEDLRNNKNHLRSVYEDPNTGIYNFVKSKNHPTVSLELDWYNSKDAADFRSKYDLDTSGDYYRYVPKPDYNITLPEVTVLGNKKAEGGSIHISPSKRGTFTAAATKHGMGVQEFASKVLANKDNYSPAMVKKANFAKNASKWKHDLGGYLFEEGGSKVTLVDSDKVRMNNSGVFSDENGNIIGDSVVLPKVTVKPTTPQTNDSSYYQQWLMREANRGGRNMSLSDREAYDRMISKVANQNEVKNFTGFDGTIYNHGSGALKQVSPEFDILTLGRQLYTDGILGLANKTTKNYKPNFAKINTPKDEELVASISTDYSAPHGNYETYFNNYNSRVFDRGTLENTLENVAKTGKAVTSKSNNPSIPSKLNIDSDKRFMLFEPGKYINYDIGNMSIKEIESTFGPDAVRYKKLYDIAKAHNFEGKYAQIGEDAQYNILNRFAINRNDPDISRAIAEAKGIYDIPEYADRFKRWGTLGDTFITDAKARIDNATIQGLSRNLKIKGQHGVTGGAYTKPDATGIGIKNTDSSLYLTEMTRHEMNHVGHGLRNQPKWMEIHNEKFRPIVKEGRTTETSLDKYYDEMDELVERGKTTVEYANKTRKKGETLDAALERVYNEAAGDIYNPKVPSDIRQMVARYTKESTLNFWKNFVGGSIPFGLGYTAYKGSNRKE